MKMKKILVMFCLILIVSLPIVQAQQSGTTTLSPVIDANIPSFYNRDRIDISGVTEIGADIRLYVNGQLVRTAISSDGTFTFNSVVLGVEGDNTVRIDAYLGTKYNSHAYTIFVDLVDPVIQLTEEVPSVLNTAMYTLAGTVSELAMVKIFMNSDEVYNQQTDSFSHDLTLAETTNTIKITAEDATGNLAEEEYTIEVDIQPPTLDNVEPLKDTPFYYEGRAIDDVSGKTEAGAEVFMYVTSSVTQEPGNLTTEKIQQLAQYKKTADSGGNFKFDDVDFEHPLPTVEGMIPQQVSPSQQALVGQGLQTDDRLVKIYIVVKDKVGLTVQQQFNVNIGSCFSGNFDFSISTPMEYQTPILLSPDRLDAGTEVISFVLSLDYRGRIAKNRQNITDTSQDYWEIESVRVDPACRSDMFLDREPSYKYACQIMPQTPQIQQQVDLAKTNWFFRYNLMQTSQFTNFSEDFWETLKNNQLKFPLQVTVTYTEKSGGKLESKTQTVCREVAFPVDIPIDPRKVLPDELLDASRSGINETIKTIDKVIEPLTQVVNYIGLACMGGTLIRFVLQIYRRFAETWAIESCILGEAASNNPKKLCYIKTQQTLDGCYYISSGEDKPIPDEAMSSIHKPVLVCPDPKNMGTRVIDLSQSTNAEYFAGVISAWKLESNVYTIYRFICDRTFCHASPAKWTQSESVATIRQQQYKERACSPDASTAMFLTPIDNCYKTYGKDGQNVLQIAYTSRTSIKGDKCYVSGNKIYMESDKKKQGEVDYTELKRIDRDGENAPAVKAISKGNTFYTADNLKCEDACKQKGGSSKWVGQCALTRETLPGDNKNIWYTYGPTEDCWTSKGVGAECYCKNDEEAEWKDELTGFRTWVAGLEKGDKQIAGETPGKWPWSYRQWQIYRSSDGQRGVYYPEERYYSGRDQSAAFGLNYLPDYIFDTKTTEVNPFTQHIGAIQSVCLSGILSRLKMLRSILVGMDNCLMQIQTTGQADAGVCKELFTQYVCNLVYKVFTLFQDKCTPTGVGETKSEKDVFGITRFFKTGSGAITDTIDDMSAELSEDYGNANLNSFLEGGSRSLMTKVCLAAFGYDVGFDANAFVDAAYSVPFKTSVSVFSSEGGKGRREYLGFDPTNLQSMYEYRAAWAVYPGCEISSYNVDLAAVTEAERRKYNLDCSAVNNKEPGSAGCDNLMGGSEKTRPFFTGGSLTQGNYVDQNEAKVITDAYRYDHIKVTINLAPEWDAEKCFPSENREGDQGIFYFPISDVTPRDIVQCSVSVADGRFSCIGFGLGTLVQAWIENVKCQDPESSDWMDCDRIDFSATANNQGNYDKLRVRANIFSSGEKICLKSYVQTTSGVIYPEKNFWWDVIGIGQPRTVTMEMELMGTIDEQTFGANLDFVPSPGGSISLQIQHPSTVVSPFIIRLRTRQADREDKTVGDVLDAKVEYQMRGKFSQDWSEWTPMPANGILQDPERKFNFKINRVNLPYSNGDATSGFWTDEITIEPVAKTTYADQMWKLFLELYNPNTYGNCQGSGVTKITAAPGLAFKTDQQIQIKVSKQRFTSAEDVAYKAGRSAYESRDYTGAADKFKGVYLMVVGDKQEVLSYYWYVVSMIRQDDKNVCKFKKEIDDAMSLFEARKLVYDLELKSTPEYKMVVAYLDAIKTKLNDGRCRTP